MKFTKIGLFTAVMSLPLLVQATPITISEFTGTATAAISLEGFPDESDTNSTSLPNFLGAGASAATERVLRGTPTTTVEAGANQSYALSGGGDAQVFQASLSARYLFESRRDEGESVAGEASAFLSTRTTFTADESTLGFDYQQQSSGNFDFTFLLFDETVGEILFAVDQTTVLSPLDNCPGCGRLDPIEISGLLGHTLTLEVLAEVQVENDGGVEFDEPNRFLRERQFWNSDLIVYTPVPAPGTLAILGFGLLALLAGRRKRAR